MLGASNDDDEVYIEEGYTDEESRGMCSLYYLKLFCKSVIPKHK